MNARGRARPVRPVDPACGPPGGSPLARRTAQVLPDGGARPRTRTGPAMPPARSRARRAGQRGGRESGHPARNGSRPRRRVRRCIPRRSPTVSDPPPSPAPAGKSPAMILRQLLAHGHRLPRLNECRTKPSRAGRGVSLASRPAHRDPCSRLGRRAGKRGRQEGQVANRFGGQPQPGGRGYHPGSPSTRRQVIHRCGKTSCRPTSTHAFIGVPRLRGRAPTDEEGG